MGKYSRITMELSGLTDLIAFADSEEMCKKLIEKEDWHLLFSPALGNEIGIPAKIWIVYKEVGPSESGYKGSSSDVQPKVK